jgi:hypothetical protein
MRTGGRVFPDWFGRGDKFWIGDLIGPGFIDIRVIAVGVDTVNYGVRFRRRWERVQ